MKKLSRHQLALSNFPYYKYSFRYAADSLQRMGAETIELYACDPHFHIDDCGIPEARAVYKQLKDRGIKVGCLTPEQCKYPLNIASQNPVSRKRSLEVYVKCIQFAVEMDCSLCQLLTGWSVLDEPLEDAWKRSVESMEYLGHIAEGYGVEIALEVSPRQYATITNSPTTMQFLKEVGSPALHGMIDVACMGDDRKEPVADAIRVLGKELRHVHFGDGNPGGHLILGDGSLDLEGALNQLAEADYKGLVSLEIMNGLYEENPEEAMARSAAWMRERMN